MIGSTVSHYKILEKLGEGGMGVVYKAQDLKLDRPVAIKFLPPHLSASEENKARFMQEARATAALNHPNILNVYDNDEQENRMFFVMEFIEGKTLKSHIMSLKAGEGIPALNHPNILNVYDIDEQENRMFFVMEFIEGKTLKSHIMSLKAGEGIPVRQAIDW